MNTRRPQGNPNFPNWADANKELSRVAGEFRVELRTFLELGEAELAIVPRANVPDEYAEKYQEIMGNFVNWLFREVNLDSVVEPFLLSPFTPRTRAELTEKIKGAFCDYETRTTISPRRVLAHVLGIRPYHLCPRELQNIEEVLHRD